MPASPISPTSARTPPVTWCWNTACSTAESTFDFVTRLMERFGLYYFVTHAEGAHTLNFADDPASHTALTEAIPYRFREADWHSTDDQLWDWSAEAQIQPGAYTLRDYNFTTPKADLTAKSLLAGGHTYGTNEVYDYPGQYDVANDGQKAAQVRMQDFAARRQVSGGTSNSRKLGCGSRFTLSDFPDAAANQEYLVIESICTVERAETRAFQAGEDDDLLDTFNCVLRALPSSHPFRLPNSTVRPIISGPQTARVAGESGQEVTTDQYGRIKVKFPWDRRHDRGREQLVLDPGVPKLGRPGLGRDVHPRASARKSSSSSSRATRTGPWSPARSTTPK